MSCTPGTEAYSCKAGVALETNTCQSRLKAACAKEQDPSQNILELLLFQKQDTKTNIFLKPDLIEAAPFIRG